MSWPQRLWTVLLILAIAGGVVSLALLDDGQTLPLGWALFGAVAAVALLRPFRFAGALAVIAAAAAYSGAQYARESSADAITTDPEWFVRAGVAGAGYLLAGMLGHLASRDRGATAKTARGGAGAAPSADLLVTATSNSSEIGRQVVIAEVSRARRYDRTLTLVLVRPDGAPAFGQRTGGAAHAVEQFVEISSLVRDGVRDIDYVVRFADDVIAILLPETPLEGAHIVAERMCEAAEQRLGASLRAGLAEYPGDAESAEHLMAEAEGALEFAEAAGLVVASRMLLSPPPRPESKVAWG